MRVVPQAPLGRQGDPMGGAGLGVWVHLCQGGCQLLAQRQVRRKEAAAQAGKMQVRPERAGIATAGAGSAERLAVLGLAFDRSREVAQQRRRRGWESRPSPDTRWTACGSRPKPTYPPVPFHVPAIAMERTRLGSCLVRTAWQTTSTSLSLSFPLLYDGQSISASQGPCEVT